MIHVYICSFIIGISNTIRNTLTSLKMNTFIILSHLNLCRSTVRVVKSVRAGMGKTLYKKRMEAELKRQGPITERQSVDVVTIPIHEREIDVNVIMSKLLEYTLQPGDTKARIFHIDLAHEVSA